MLVIIDEWNKENTLNDKDKVTIIAMRSTKIKQNSFPLYIHNRLQNAMRPGNYWWMKEKNTLNDKDTIKMIVIRSTERKYNSFPQYIHIQLQNAMRSGKYWWNEQNNTLNGKDTIAMGARTSTDIYVIHFLFKFTTKYDMQ